MTTRRLPAPWCAEKMPGGYVVRDANGQALAYVYSRATETDAMQAKVLTEDEGRRVAVNIGAGGMIWRFPGRSFFQNGASEPVRRPTMRFVRISRGS
jgi:hypothetical protein